MGSLYQHKRRVVQHRRALQDQRFRPFLKRQWLRFCNDGCPDIKAAIARLNERYRAEWLVGVAVVFLLVAAVLWARVPV